MEKSKIDGNDLSLNQLLILWQLNFAAHVCDLEGSVPPVGSFTIVPPDEEYLSQIRGFYETDHQINGLIIRYLSNYQN